MKKISNGSQEIWSAKRVTELTMSRITAKSTTHAKARRPAAILIACIVLVFAMSATAFAANTFGIRDLVGNFFIWNVNESANVLELNTAGKTISVICNGDNDEYEIALMLKSMTLSPTELTFSYTFKSDSGEAPLPGTLGIVMSGGAIIGATITDTSIDGNLVTGTAHFSTAVNLEEAVCVLFGGPPNGQLIVTMSIVVNADLAWHYDPPVQLPTEEGSVEIAEAP